MIGGEHSQDADRAARWPCTVCGRGEGCNLIYCTQCLKWVHRKCAKYRNMNAVVDRV